MWSELKILGHDNIVSAIFQNKIIYPTHVQIELTEACNHRCIFCPWHGEKHYDFQNIDYTGKRHIDKQLLFNTLNDLISGGVKAIAFTGSGEPLLYPYITDVLELLIDKNIDFAFTTNFSVALNEKTLNLLTHARWLRWSFNAATEDTYYIVHNPKNNDAFNLAVKNVAQLISIRKNKTVKLGASFVIHERNFNDILPVVELTKSLKVDSISFRPAIDMSRKEEIVGYDEVILSKLKKAQDFSSGSFVVYTNLNRLNDTKMVFDNSLKCYYSNHSVHIISSGAVYPCCMTRFDKRFEIGSLISQSFKDFWYSSSRIDNYKKLLIKNCPPCRHNITNEALSFMYEKVKDNFI